MNIDGSILAFLILMPVLAAIGLTTLAAFVIMPLLGLVSEWSFRRIFFVSFLLGLIAPVLLIGSIVTSIQDGSLERELGDGLAQVLPGTGEMGNWRDIVPQVEEIGEQVERGDITPEEGRERLERIVQERTGFEVDLDDVEFSGDGNRLRIESE